VHGLPHSSLLSLSIAFDGVIDEVRQLRSPLGSVVDDELETRRVTQLQAPTDLPSQETPGSSESNAYLLRGVSGSKRRKEHARGSHIGRETHGRNGHVADTRILHLADDNVRKHPLNL
jgi:hypothetical protein